MAMGAFGYRSFIQLPTLFKAAKPPPTSITLTLFLFNHHQPRLHTFIIKLFINI